MCWRGRRARAWSSWTWALPASLPEHPGLVRAKVAPGTQDFTRTAAMTRDQAEQAVLVGLEVAAREVAQGLDVLGVGEMGIGNTTPAAALTAVFTGAPPERVAGRGTGLDSAGVAALRQGLALHHPEILSGRWRRWADWRLQAGCLAAQHTGCR